MSEAINIILSKEDLPWMFVTSTGTGLKWEIPYRSSRGRAGTPKVMSTIKGVATIASIARVRGTVRLSDRSPIGLDRRDPYQFTK